MITEKECIRSILSPISVDLYADDTTLYSASLDKCSLEKNLQKALDSVYTWCLENGMLINIEKTKLMLIASRQKRNSLIDSDLKITFNDIDLKISSNEKRIIDGLGLIRLFF